MFSHVMVGANDIEESKTFYDAVFQVLGHPPGSINPEGQCFYFADNNVFALTKPINGQPATHGNGTTIGFLARSTKLVDTWHEVGVAHGGVPCEDPPGVRDFEDRQYYIAYLRDPAGNKICALHSIS